MMVKTSRAHFDAMMAEVQRLHTYQVPEIVAVPIIAGAENYLAWLAASLQQP
jgi:periplasmic divalent cation tolerance protein